MSDNVDKARTLKRWSEYLKGNRESESHRRGRVRREHKVVDDVEAVPVEEQNIVLNQMKDLRQSSCLLKKSYMVVQQVVVNHIYVNEYKIYGSSTISGLLLNTRQKN